MELGLKRTINIKGKLYSFDHSMVMGILNITPDSFYDGGKYSQHSDVLKRCEQILKEGANIIDIGAYSSRPGAVHISSEEELVRLAGNLELIRKEFPESIISVDTFRSEVAEKVVKDYEVDIINDISAGDMDSNMFATIAALKVPYIMMHMQGTPQTMQDEPSYSNILQEMSVYFSKKLNELHSLGVNDLIIDPGFGFGKNLDHNYALLRELNQLQLLDVPILVGLSRKSMIYKLLDEDSKGALNGTTSLNTVALLNGANILRVHDVKEGVECVKLVRQLLKAKY